MALAAADLHKLPALANVVDKVFLGVQPRARLIAVGDAQFLTQAHAARVRRQFAGEHADQRAFAGAVGADDTHAIAALDQHRAALQNRPATEAHADRFEFGDPLAGALRGLYVQRRAGAALAALPAFLAHGFKSPHAAFVARAPRLDALANPALFLRQAAVEQGIGLVLGGQLLLAMLHKAAIVAPPQREMAAIEFGNVLGHTL